MLFRSGKGLAGYFLRPLVHHSWDSPEMPLLLFAGPLVGTQSPTSGRMTISSRSPLTGTVGDTSVGGKFGTQLKKAGWDGIIITGKSKNLCGIHISDSAICFVDASSFNNKEISTIAEKLPAGGSYALTGPAADHGVLFANICIDGHYFSGRTGLGLVMGSKNLKYIHIRGTGNVGVDDPNGIKKAKEEILRLVSSSPVLKGEMGIAEYGTGTLYDLMLNRRMMPTDNFRSTFFTGAGALNANYYKNKYQTTKSGCRGCHILCKKIASDGRIIPEFETMSHFTALLNNHDAEVVMESNRICNETGMDTITAAVTLSCYAEIFQKRKFEPYEITGLLHDIAYSVNQGEVLKLGSYRYALAKIGRAHV